MKTQLILEFDADEGEALAIYVHAMDLMAAIDDAKEIIRSKLKYGEPDKEPDEVLEQIRAALCVAGIDN